MDSEGCLICCDGLIDTSFNSDNFKILCRALELTLPSSTLSVEDSNVYFHLLQFATYCLTCVRKVQELGNLFTELDKLKNKLEVSSRLIEEQLKRSFETRKAVTNRNTLLERSEISFTNTKEVSRLTSNQDIRGNIIFHMRGLQVNTVTRWRSDSGPAYNGFPILSNIDIASPTPVELEVLQEKEKIFLDYNNVPFDDSPAETSRPPSPSASVGSTHSFEEKYMPPLGLSDNDNISLTTIGPIGEEETLPSKEDLLTHPIFLKLQKQKQNKFEVNNAKLTKRKRHTSRIACPFASDCGVSLNKTDEISIDAHFRRVHEGLRNCYICNICHVGFTGSKGLKAHQEKNCQSIDHKSNASEIHRQNICTESSEIQTIETSLDIDSKTQFLSNLPVELPEHCNSKITKSSFPIVVLKRLKSDGTKSNTISISPPQLSIKLKRWSEGMRRKSKKLINSRKVTSKIKLNCLDNDDGILKTKIKNKKRKQIYVDHDIDVKKAPPKRKPLNPLNKSVARIKCPIEGCTIKFKVIEEHRRQAHVRKNHEGIKNCYRCEICNIFLRDLQRWKMHTSEHTGIPAFICKYCQLVCQTQDSLRFHTRTVHEPEKIKFKCNECGKVFLYKFSLDSHMRSHRNEKPFMCEICSESFASPQYLKYHQSKHEESPYAAILCNYCGKQLSSPKCLRNHIKKLHTKIYNFKCEQCDYGAQTKSELQKHLTTRHSKERNVKCHLCPAAFKLKAALNVHMRRHTGELIKCKTCGKGFTNKGALNRHNLIHSNAQCHECQICGKKFPVRNYLYIHMKSHNKTNRKCEISKKTDSISLVVMDLGNDHRIGDLGHASEAENENMNHFTFPIRTFTNENTNLNF